MRYKKMIFASLIVLCIGLFSTSLAYTDTDNHWAENYIKKMSTNGIISGYTDGTFKPNQNMTRAELITVINRLLANIEQNDRFIPDINVKDWYYVEIRKAIESGFVEGDTNGNMRPNDLITRQEAVVMLQRALVPLGSNVLVNEYSDFDDISSWAKNSFGTFLLKGYIKGYTDNTIKPKKNITRAEVVAIISNIINNFVVYGEYTGKSDGSLLINKPDVKLKDFVVEGNLIVTEGADNFEISNVQVNGDLVIRKDFTYSSDDIKFEGKKYYLNGKPDNKDNKKYINDDYGISFSIPNDTAVEFLESNKTITTKQKNYITFRVNQSDSLYFLSFEDGVDTMILNSPLSLTKMDSGFVDFYRYSLCGNEKNKTYVIYVKRDNIEYFITLYNVDNFNIIDSVANSISFYKGKLIKNHKIALYKNEDLNLKFRYPDYVAVDDSYNTGVVNENQEAYYKLFLQVNNIIDMSNYTVEQLKNILVSLEDSDGEIIESKIRKVYIYDAIEYTVKNDGKLFKSLYIIISNKLYHFVFLSSEDKMSSAGYEIYNDILRSIEF